jgi:hypothetical protein
MQYGQQYRYGRDGTDGSNHDERLVVLIPYEKIGGLRIATGNITVYNNS